MSIEPVLVSAEVLYDWAADRYETSYPDPPRIANELLMARELLTLLAAGNIAGDPPFANAVLVWCPEKGWQPLADVRPDLAAYLDALPKEDS